MCFHIACSGIVFRPKNVHQRDRSAIIGTEKNELSGKCGYMLFSAS